MLMCAGFPILSAAGIPASTMSADLAKRVPRYPTVPVARIGRLTVDDRYRGLKLGFVLLLTWSSGPLVDVAVFGVVVDAKDDKAEAFYRHHGFAAYSSAPGMLIAPLK